MAKLYVVRHASVHVDFGVPSSEWVISEDGIRATRDLVLTEPWSEVRHIYHSPEPKAAVTARIIGDLTGIQTTVVDALHELRIPTINPHDEFVRRVGLYLAGFPDPEFEDWDMATNRIVDAVQNIIRLANGSSVAMVSHGRILTVLFSYWLKRRMTVDAWRSIRLPDLSVVDMDTWQVDRGFFSNLAV